MNRVARNEHTVHVTAAPTSIGPGNCDVTPAVQEAIELKRKQEGSLLQKTDSLLGDPSPAKNEDNEAHGDGSAWAWVVFVAIFLDFVISSGIYYSQGIFFVPVWETFGESRSRTAWAFSINSSVHYLAGPLGSFLLRRIGPRNTLLLSGALAAVGYLGSAFSNSLFIMYITLGIINGVGTCLNHCGAVVGLSLYFCKRRSLVLGLAMAGSGVGVLTIGPGIAMLVPEAGWRESMILCASLSLAFGILGLTIRRRLKMNESGEKSKSFCFVVSMLRGKCHTFFKNSGSTCDFNGEIDSKIAHCDMNDQFIINRKTPTNQFIMNSETVQWRTVLITNALNAMALSAMYALIKDWINNIEWRDAMPIVLVMLGVGDIIGRIMAGIIYWKVKKFRSSDVMMFGLAQLVLTSVLCWAAVATTKLEVLVVVLTIGITAGFQMVLTAVLPMNKNDVDGLGIIQLLGGIGALAGPPAAGYLVDELKTYHTTLLVTAMVPLIGTLICLLCFCFLQYTAKKYKYTLTMYLEL